MPKQSFIDLHCHTVFSDGSLTPEAVVRKAAGAGVAVLAITDHDDVQCWPRAKAAADEAGIRMLTGVELSTFHAGEEVHILCYGIDPTYQPLLDELDHFKRERETRTERMIEKLQACGLEITMDDVLGLDARGALGRAHLATFLAESGQTKTVQQAFDKWIGRGKPAFVEKSFLDPEKSCALAHDAGGVTVIAHPKLCGAERFLGELVDMGLDGIEVLHSNHSNKDIRAFTALAEHYGILKTGGSDFHGRAKPDVHFGGVKTPMEWLAPLEEAIAARQDAAAGARRV